MIGEVESFAARKGALNACNVFIALIAAILMIVACASYKSNTQTIQAMPFFILSSSLAADPTGLLPSACQYIGLLGFCGAVCGSTALIAANDPSRTCTDATTNTYALLYANPLTCNSGTYPTGATADFITGCDVAGKCVSGGKVTIAFAVISVIAALFTMVMFAWRMTSDGACQKLLALACAIGTFVCCVIAFAGFQPCGTGLYNIAKTNDAIGLLKLGVSPGLGGIMAVLSFVFFIYVMLMAIMIPSKAPTAAGNSGLDNKK